MATVTVNVTAVRSADVDEHAAALSEWNQRYLQLARGRFSGRLSHLEFSDGLKLFRETTNIKISEFFVTPNNRTSFAIPLPGSDAVRCCNEEARPGDLIVFRPGEGYHLECRGAFDVIGIEIENDVELDFSRGGVRLAKADPSLGTFLITAIDKITANGPSGRTSPVCSELTSEISARCRAQLLSTNVAKHQSTPEPSGRSAIVARARTFIASNCQEPISVQDLARTLDISTRTLEYSFQEVLDTTPASYIKIVRLHEARRAIRRSAPQDTVTNIAATWGFWHFGRFASDYRKLFGELPSETRTQRRAFDS